MMTTSEPILAIRDLHKTFGRTEVLTGIGTDVREGEVVGLIGASGSGKSTLLRCVNRLETPTSGAVYFRGAEVGSSKRSTAGRSASARAMATRCCWPPDSSPG